MDVLENDAEVHPDIALPVVKLNLLFDPEDDPPMKTLGLKYTSAILQNDRAAHELFIFTSTGPHPSNRDVEATRRSAQTSKNEDPTMPPHAPDWDGDRSRDVG